MQAASFFWQIVALLQQADTLLVFASEFGVLTMQLIVSRAWVSIQIEEGFLFFFQLLNDQALDAVFKHSGVVASMETIAII